MRASQDSAREIDVLKSEFGDLTFSQDLAKNKTKQKNKKSSK
jgi:hypothetical protein